MHVVVTGASSGIGEGLVRDWIAQGASVTMVARRREQMEAIAASTGGQTHIVVADLSDVERCGDWIDEAIERQGPIDIFINNAGMQFVECSEEGTRQGNEKLLSLNLSTPLELMRQLLPAMLERRQGTIVNIASLAALAPTPFMLLYNASKAGLGAASESLRGELRGTGVNVLTVYPGPVKTPMADAAVDKMGGTAERLPVGKTDLLAIKIRRAVARRRRRLVYPGIYGVSAWFPSITRWVLDRFTPSLRR